MNDQTAVAALVASGKAFYADRIRSAKLPDCTADGAARRWAGQRQFATDDCVSGAVRVLKKKVRESCEKINDQERLN
jgi:hypothetical protein